MITMEAIGDPTPPGEITITFSSSLDFYGRAISPPANYVPKSIENWDKPIQWGNGG
jgi:hypothetical protein